MGRKDANHAKNDIEKYRKQLGKQEFKGRNKKNTLAVKSRAQARAQESPLKTGLYALALLVLILGAVYFFLYFGVTRK